MANKFNRKEEGVYLYIHAPTRTEILYTITNRRPHDPRNKKSGANYDVESIKGEVKNTIVYFPRCLHYVGEL